MHHIKVIKDGNVNNVVKEQLVDGVQYMDGEPRKGSFNGVTSDGVAKAVAESVEQSNQEMKDMEEMFLVNLPCAANTLRFKFSKNDYDPTVAGVGSDSTWKKVNAKFHNVWDWTKSGTSFNKAFDGCFNDIDNKVSVIAVGDTSAVTDTAYMFRYCKSLARICLFDTSAVTNMSYMFQGCSKVEGGALALYQQASTQSTPPSLYDYCFTNCGKDTVTGAAELAQIPASWGGTLQEP